MQAHPLPREAYEAAVAMERAAWIELQNAELGDPNLELKRRTWLEAAEAVHALALSAPQRRT